MTATVKLYAHSGTVLPATSRYGASASPFNGFSTEQKERCTNWTVDTEGMACVLLLCFFFLSFVRTTATKNNKKNNKKNKKKNKKKKKTTTTMTTISTAMAFWVQLVTGVLYTISIILVVVQIWNHGLNIFDWRT
jgi:predicted histidine transporter YuiF (NhaC family)